MNGTQIQTTLAPLVSFLAGLLAAKVPWLDVGAWTSIIGACLGIGGVIWGAVAAKKSSLISTTAALPDVSSIKLTPMASTELVNSTPPNVTK